MATTNKENQITRMKRLFELRSDSAKQPVNDAYKDTLRPHTVHGPNEYERGYYDGDIYEGYRGYRESYDPRYMQEEGMLTRRTTMGGSEVNYFPAIPPHRASSLYSSRTDPHWLDYSRGHRLLYERNHSFDRSFLSNSKLRKENAADKFVTFYRDSEASEPELRLIVSDTRFRHLNHLIDDVTRLIGLRDHERFIHSPHGHILRHMSEFQDGGIYIFGPPDVYHNHDYLRFRRLNTPDLLDSEFDDSDVVTRPPVMRKDGKRKIKIISNLDKTQSIFMLDEALHKSLPQVMKDITDQIFQQQGYVQRLRTRKGKTIQSLGELFFGIEDIFVAICSWDRPFYNQNQYNDYNPAYPDNYYRGGDNYYRGGGGPPIGGRYYSGGPGYHNSRHAQIDYYDRERSQMRPFEVTINNKRYVFEPPHTNYFDALLRPFDVPPYEHMAMEWVYGYNGKNCRNNLYILPSEEVLYFVAKIVVMFDINARRQRFYAEHTDEIRCIAQHPNMWIFASGQVAGGVNNELGHVRIWDSKCLITLNVLSLNEVELSVECLAFSKGDNGIKLASISTSGTEWNMNVWDWEEGNILSSSDAYGEIELACIFDPTDNRKLVSCGKNHVFFWNVASKIATYKDGEFSDHHVSEYVTCLGFNSRNELLTADSNAYLHTWDRLMKKTTSVIKTPHTGSIITMAILSDNYVITCGGSDRTLTLMNYNQMIPTVSQQQIPKENGGIVAIVPVQSSSKDLRDISLMIGTSMNDVMIGSMSQEFDSIVNGTSDQMTAVATHPTENSFLSAGMDLQVILWSAKQHSQIWNTKIDEPCTAAQFFPAGEYVAIGTSTGQWMVLTLSDSYQVASFECDRSPITCISYSTNGNFVAVGTENGALFLYHCYDDGKSYRYITNIKTWAENITSIDWTLNEQHLRFVTSNYNFEIWDIERRCEERNRTALRNLQFGTETSPISYYTAGIWNGAERNVEFKTSGKSANNTLFCTGSNNGSVRLYHYPCDTRLALYNEANNHSGNVSHVSFLPNDHDVISSGENDYCIIQWKLVRSKEIRDNERPLMSVPNGYYQGSRPLLSQRKMSKYNNTSSGNFSARGSLK